MTTLAIYLVIGMVIAGIGYALAYALGAGNESPNAAGIVFAVLFWPFFAILLVIGVGLLIAAHLLAWWESRNA